MTQTLSNIPEFSVSDLSRALKQTVESSFSHVRVRGELSRVTIAKSGHLYSDLKDENAVLNVICWRATVDKLSIRPQEGMEVVCTGRMTTYPGTSRYQLIIESMELAGEGALLKLLEDRRKKLASEGLFAEERKKPLPFFPQTIGVVTSPTGAVIRDIIHRVRDRCPCRIIVWPVQVQGAGADKQIVQGIEGFNKAKAENRPDVLIVARGGGSLEDLMAFNEENVVRAVAASDIPVISAVGHETDTTLIDFVSDRRAPTPTGAAEMAVPVIDQLRVQVTDYYTRLSQFLKRMIEIHTRTLNQITRLLDRPERLFEPAQQKLDMSCERLNNVFSHFVARQDKTLHGLGARLRTPETILDRAHLLIHNISDRLGNTKEIIFNTKKEKLHSLERMLETLSYKSVLNRGFAVLKDDDGSVLTTKDTVQNALSVIATVKDGDVKLK